MLEYTKLVLKKVSFDSELFKKELSKSIEWLKENDLIKLHNWLIDNYINQHEEIINTVFARVDVITA